MSKPVCTLVQLAVGQRVPSNVDRRRVGVRAGLPSNSSCRHRAYAIDVAANGRR